jgi:hypothetical protein
MIHYPTSQKLNGTYDLDKAARFFQDLASPNKSEAGVWAEKLASRNFFSSSVVSPKGGQG